MKKAFFTVALSCVVATSFSQQLSVTAGGTYSKWRDDFTSYRLGFDVGALCVFQSDSVPFCFNAALMLVDKGVCLDGKSLLRVEVNTVSEQASIPFTFQLQSVTRCRAVKAV